MQTSTDRAVYQLNAFLRGELVTSESYRKALDRIDRTDTRRSVEDCARSHAQRVQMLADEVRRYGGTPVESAGAWGTLSRLVQAGANVFGEKAAILALEQREDREHQLYARELFLLEPPARAFVELQMLPEQRRTHDIMSRLKRALA